MTPLTVLVCGGRDYTDTRRVFRILRAIAPAVIVHGDARGADRRAGMYAKRRGVEERKYPADWQRYGKRAGLLRNQEMLDHEQIDLGVAFPGGTGTADMVQRMRRAGILVLEVKHGTRR